MRATESLHLSNPDNSIDREAFLLCTHLDVLSNIELIKEARKRNRQKQGYLCEVSKMTGKRIVLTHHKAAKSHICDLDGKIIKKGEHYTMAQGMPKNGVYPITGKYCLSHDWSMVRRNMLSEMGY